MPSTITSEFEFGRISVLNLGVNAFTAALCWGYLKNQYLLCTEYQLHVAYLATSSELGSMPGTRLCQVWTGALEGIVKLTVTEILVSSPYLLAP